MYLAIFFIIGALITMLVEGTYFKEVTYTSLLALFIVGLGICAQKFNWGKHAQDKSDNTQADLTNNL